MNYIFPLLIIAAFLFSFACGNPEAVLTAGISGAASAAEVLLSFAGIMCFWSGMLKILEESGGVNFFARLLSPLISRLFPKAKKTDNIAMNIIANLLGIGNAATPTGIAAMRELDKENGFSCVPSREMCRFALLNTASLQIFPTTVISILSACGASDPFSIVPCIWISSVLSLSAALLAEKITGGVKK